MSLLHRNWLPEGYYEEDSMGSLNRIEDPREIEEARRRGDLYYHDGYCMGREAPSLETFSENSPSVETCNLFLDDIRDPGDVVSYLKDTDYLKLKWEVVRSYEEFTAFVEKKFAKTGSLPDLITFDHDLGNEHYSHTSGTIPYEEFREKTGYDCAKWLVDFCIDKNLPLPTYKVHSMNPVGAKNIISYFENFKKHVQTN